MARIKMHIPKAKLPFYPPYEVKYRLQNGVSTMTNNSHNNETSDRCKATIRSKCFLIVNAIFLSKAFCNKVSLVSFNKSISLGLNLVNAPTTYYRLTKRQINHIPNVIFVKVI